MNLLDDPVPFKEAIKAVDSKKLLPTNLDSAGLRLLDAGTRRQSIFSAENNLTDVLDGIQKGVASIVNPSQEKRADRVTKDNPEGKVTTGLDPASMRLQLKQLLKDNHYSPDKGIAGTIKDLSSDARINLVVKTNVELAHGAGRFIQENSDPDVVDLWPALELVRYESRAKPRDWNDRWRQAADDSGDDDAARMLDEHGRMVARKDSPIWDSLGSTDLFPDGLDNPFPPFAFNSGMWTEEVSRDEAVKLGLIEEGDKIAAQPVEIEKLFNFANS
jgi:hypothetical protein